MLSGAGKHLILHVASKVESFSVKRPVLVTALSNSALVEVANSRALNQNFSFSIHPLAVCAISPVALSILISSPHCEAREVVVVVQAVQ